ncbi:hypothetical protein S40285_10824 [Stachybotrys chlorohalonatus IBT 40285]|uniref:Uncharacterized protein n=1 Tax=Stachybotrys chlorohalonatus (strain IBT 40285) TaxID=1283841 RepID=A0A084QXQ9_STAC4|nr:hypothetical protein S40285_10824 [Stachybotrys chlorohalonata IBT 40285]
MATAAPNKNTSLGPRVREGISSQIQEPCDTRCSEGYGSSGSANNCSTGSATLTTWGSASSAKASINLKRGRDDGSDRPGGPKRPVHSSFQETGNAKIHPRQLRCWFNARWPNLFPPCDDGQNCATAKRYKQCRGSTSFTDFQHLYHQHAKRKHKLHECGRCERLFEDEKTKGKHEKSAERCEALESGAVQPANEDMKGISPTAAKSIKEYTKAKGIHADFDKVRSELEDWVGANLEIYIGRSTTPRETGERELAKWFMVWYTLFPGEEIPVHPFLDTTSIPVVQINRVMHVANDKMAACVNDGRLTRLSEKDLETISDCFKTGITDVLHEQLNGSSSPRETSPTLSLTNPPLDIQTHNLNVPSQPPTTVPATVSGTLSYPGNSRCGSPAGTLVPSQIYPGQISNGVSTDDFSTSLPSPGAEKDTTVWELFPDFCLPKSADFTL